MVSLWFTFRAKLGIPSDSKNWPSKRFSATILSAKLQIQLMGLNQICPIFPSESLYIKSMFSELFGAYLEGNAVSSTKGCARVCHYKMQCMTKVIQKLDPCVHSAEELCLLNCLQTQPYTTKWCLNLNQPPLLQNGLGVFMMDQKPMSVTTKWLYVTIL